MALAACGGSGGFNGDDGTGGVDPGTGGGSTAPKATNLAISLPNGNQLSADADTAAEGISIVAIALTGSNAGLPGVVVDFSADSGEISPGSATTDANGRATAVLTTATDPTPGRSILVTAKDRNNGSANGEVTINVVAPAGGSAPTPRLGTLTGATFAPGAFTFQLANLAAGGSSGFRVDVYDTTNNLVFTDPVNMTFSSPCITAGTAVVNPSAAQPNTATASDGAVLATYVARGCSGNDTVTARAVINGLVQTAQGTINVQPSTLASVRFISATPINIGLRGSGLQETSAVTFQVVNASGGPIPNQAVSFSLNTNIGGISVSPVSGTTDTNGRVSTVVTSGTVSTVVRVTASATSGGTTVSSQSEQLTVTTGIPDQDSFSLSAQCVNVEGLTRDNVQVPMTLLASDRNNNPAPDSTAVTFTTEGGSIIGSCVMQNGACTLNWRSQNPRPLAYNGCQVGTAAFENDLLCSVLSPSGGSSRAGRSTVLAFAVGEESFDDTNNDGLFSPGERFGDLSEAFLDYDEDGARDATNPVEPFRDFNNSGGFNGPDGQFNGLLCDNGDPNNIQCPTPRTLHVRDSIVIVMSGSSPVIDQNPVASGGDVSVGCPTATACYVPSTRTITIKENETFSLDVVVRDVNNQPMPATTSIAFTASGNAGAIQGTSTFAVPCTSDDTREGNLYGISFKGADLNIGDPNGSSSVELKVTSPSGVQTFYRFNVVTLAPTV